MRSRNKFSMSVAEVDGIDRHQMLVISASCVTKDAGYASELIAAAVRFVEQDHHLDAQLIDVERDLLDGD
jgi:uncharacterized protein YlxP (DUF503 family)